MPTRLRIDKLCDWHFQDGEQEVEATHSFAAAAMETTTKFPGMKSLLACDEHAKVMFDLIELLGQVESFKPEQAAVTKAPAALFDTNSHKPPSAQVQECALCDATPSGSSALVGHIWGKHCSITKPPYPDKCPECGIKGLTPASLAQHRRIEHDFDAVKFAYAQARKHPK